MGRQRIENLLGALALSVSDAIARRIEKVDGAYGSDTFALVLLLHSPSLRSDTLSRQLRLAQSSTVRLVDRLENAGLVQRVTGSDKRTVLLSLTARGQRAAGNILSARQGVLRELVDRLTEGERSMLHDIAGKLLTDLTVDLKSGEHNCRLCDEDVCGLGDCPVETRYQLFDGALPAKRGKGRPKVRKPRVAAA